MEVIKKDGRREEFNIKKIRRSIASSASDCGIVLTESDLTNACNMIENTISSGGKKETSSYEIFGVVVYKLQELKYSKVVQAYLETALSTIK